MRLDCDSYVQLLRLELDHSYASNIDCDQICFERIQIVLSLCTWFSLKCSRLFLQHNKTKNKSEL